MEELETVKSELATEKSKSSELGSQVAKMNQIISASQEALQQEQKNVELLKEAKVSSKVNKHVIQGDPSACRKGYVDISSDSNSGHPETELIST